MNSKLRSMLAVVALCSTPSALPIPPARSLSQSEVLIVAISRDASLLSGGLESSRDLSGNKVHLGIVGLLTADGRIRNVRCDSDDQSECVAVQSHYLSRPIAYQTVSWPQGRLVTSAPKKLSDCFETSSVGMTPSRSIDTAIAATDTSRFGQIERVQEVTNKERHALQLRVSQLVSTRPTSLPIPKLDRIEKLRLGSEFTQVIVAEGSMTTEKWSSMFFGIWRVTRGRYHLLISNVQTGFEEPENYLGTIKLKQETSNYIITSARDAEGYRFNVYALRDASLVRVFHGGGGSC